MSRASRHAAQRMARECIGLRARYLGRLVTRMYDDALRPLGLTAAQLSLLGAIEGLAPASAKQVGERLDLEKSTLSRNLRLLSDRGWVRVLQPDRGRHRLLELTPAGRRLLVRAMPAWQEAQVAARRRLGEETAEALQGLLPGQERG